MAGFAVLFDPDSTPQTREKDFQSLLHLTTQFKQLEMPSKQVIGRYCTAAKLDGPASRCPGVVRDDVTGSWLLAAGAPVCIRAKQASDDLLDLLRAYIERGIRGLDEWDGHFALAIYNGIDGSLAVITDPMGMFAVYLKRDGRRVLVSTSSMAIANLCGSTPDEMFLEQFLRSGRQFDARTMWQGVIRIHPATEVVITPSGLTEHEYWRISFDPTLPRPRLDEALNQADEIIQRSVHAALAHEEKIWADLTAGLDTRLLTIYIAKNGKPFTAYCVGPEGNTDVTVSGDICREMGWEYRRMSLPDTWDVDQCDWFEKAIQQGDAILSVQSLAGFLNLMQDRSQVFTANTNGGGADEWRYPVFAEKRLLMSPSAPIDYDWIMDRWIFSRIPIQVLKQDRTIQVRAAMKEYLSDLCKPYSQYPMLTQSEIAFRRHRHPTHAGAYLSTAAGRMRTVMPFCHKEPENYGISLRPTWRIKYLYGFVRNLIEKANPRLAEIDYGKGGPALPIRWSNFYRFKPLWKYLANRSIDKVSYRLTGHRVLLWSHPPEPEYPLQEWQQTYLQWAVSRKLLVHEAMYSGALYAPSELDALVQAGLNGNRDADTFLDRVITIEMALRAAGNGLD